MCLEADRIDQHLWEGNQSYSLPAKIGSVYTLLGESVLSVTEQMSTRGLAGPLCQTVQFWQLLAWGMAEMQSASDQSIIFIWMLITVSALV